MRSGLTAGSTGDASATGALPVSPIDGSGVIGADGPISADQAYGSVRLVNAVLSSSGYRIGASISVSGIGTIENDGADGANDVGGAGGLAGTLGAGGAAGNGTTTAGTAGAAVTGFGGAGTAGSNGSAGGAMSAPAATLGSPGLFATGRLLDGTKFGAGSGGGGGGGNGVLKGGGGGGGGGIVWVSAPAIDLSAGLVLSARGGSSASGASGDFGGAGGGGLVFTFGPLTAGTLGLVDVSGGITYDKAQHGADGHWYHVGTHDVVAPGAPSILVTSPGIAQLDFVWTPTGYAAFRHTVEMSLLADFSVLLATLYFPRGTTTHTLTGAPSGNTVYTRARSTNAIGTSDYGATSSVLVL